MNIETNSPRPGRRYLSFLLTFLAIGCLSVDATSPSPRFERISIQQGLSQITVTAMLQDRKGLIWIGTQDGLNRYDGSDFFIFRHSASDPNSLIDNGITALYEDPEGYIWVGTIEGFCRFSPRRETFLHFPTVSAKDPSFQTGIIRAFCRDRDGFTWIGTGEKGLIRLNTRTGESRRFEHTPGKPGGLRNDQVYAILSDSGGKLWVGTGNGLSLWDPGGERFTHFVEEPGQGAGIVGNFVKTLYEAPSKPGIIWAGTTTALNRFEPAKGTWKSYPFEPNRAGGARYGEISSIYEDHRRGLWIGTINGGLFRFNWDTEVFSVYNHVPGDPYSLSNSDIRCITADREGTLWIGTNGGGINTYIPRKQHFSHFMQIPGSPHSLANSQVIVIYKDSAQNLWVGSYGGGLDKYNPDTNTFTHHLPDPEKPGAINHNFVRCITEDYLGYLWVGTRGGGLNRMDRERKRFTHILHDPAKPGSLPHNVVFALHEDSRRFLWACTRNGLCRYQRETGTFIIYRNQKNNPRSLKDNNTYCIVEDNTGHLWVGTRNGGINRLDPGTGYFTHFLHDPADPKSLSHNSIMALYMDKNQHLWAGTWGGGLNRLNTHTGAITCYTEADGLSNNVITGILEDNSGCIWVSTNHGLSKLDPAAGSFRVYSDEDGLRGHEFNQGAAFKDSDGKLYFGGIHGLNAFFPGKLRENTFIPTVILTRFKKFNREVKLDPVIHYADQLTLSYRDNYFSLSFTTLSFSAPGKYRYAYRLKGFDGDWLHSGPGERTATYTNLDPGEYLFQVRASLEGKKWTSPASLKLIITPPYWKTWWFTILMFIALSAALVGVHKLRIRAIKKKRRMLRIEVRERTAQLEAALHNIKRLKGLLPICSQCKKIRDDKGYWQQVETYIKVHSEADFSHSICPQCLKEIYPDNWQELLEDQ